MNDAAQIALNRLLKIMDELREECPWDKKQTMETLRVLTLEEAHELSDAILQNDLQEVKKELGDVLLHIVFYSKIASEMDAFSITEVINSLCEKLIIRHPHIYGEVKVKDEEEVKQNWEQIKLRETGGTKSLLSGVPSSLSSLVKAYRMQEKAAHVGFDWPDKRGVWGKVEEEIQEFRQAEGLNDKTEEFGDVLFSLVNFARFEGINPDDALERTNIKFKSRFEWMENKTKELNRNLKDLSLEEMDELWKLAKYHEVR